MIEPLLYLLPAQVVVIHKIPVLKIRVRVVLDVGVIVHSHIKSEIHEGSIFWRLAKLTYIHLPHCGSWTHERAVAHRRAMDCMEVYRKTSVSSYMLQNP